MKKFWIILLFLIPLAYAIDEECQRTHLSTDIPCPVISTWKGATGICNQSNMTIYNGSGNPIQNYTWGDYNPVCNVTFNITTPGVYYYNSTIEDGIINVVRPDNMLSIVIFSFIIISFFIALGIFNQGFKLKVLSFGVGLIELVVVMSMLYMREIDMDITGIMKVNFWFMLLLGFGIGMISLIMLSLDTVNLADNDLGEKEHKKWEIRDKW